MTPREKRNQRKRWKINSRCYRSRKSEHVHENIILQENTPPPTDDENGEMNAEQARRELERRKESRDRVRRYRFKKKFEEKVSELEKQLQKYKKRFNRLKKEDEKRKRNKIIKENITPGTRVEILLDGTRTDSSKVEEVKKKLLFGEVVRDQLSQSYKKIKNYRDKQVFKKLYRVMS